MSLLKPGMTFVDIGAHIGYYSLLASRKVGINGKVFSFEPDPRNYVLLVSNIFANNCTNVIPIQKAVADYTGTSKFFVAPYSVSHSLYKDVSIPTLSILEIEVISLDDYFRQLNWPSINLVKMDIEGAEISALRGMKELCSRNPYLKLIVEFKPRRIHAAGYTIEDFFSTLIELGFHIIQDINTSEIIYYQGRIALRTLSTSTNLLCLRMD